MKALLLVVTLMAAVPLAAAGWVIESTPAQANGARSASYPGARYAAQAKVSLSEARAKALKTFPGKILSEELEHEKGGSGLRYSFDIKSGKTVHEVGIDARTGEVLENDRESQENAQSERRENAEARENAESRSRGAASERSESEGKSNAMTKISLAKARALALKAFPGKVLSEELEHEKGGSGLRYTFEIKKGQTVHEVGIDAKTGKVLENNADNG